MFEAFKFSQKQVDRHYQTALKDLKIAGGSDVPEIIFQFCFNSLIKLAITICADNGLRIKARKGHHIELIQKLAEYLNDKEIEVLANEMRGKRNRDLYDGGMLITHKEAGEYLKWTKNIFEAARKYFDKKRPRLKI